MNLGSGILCSTAKRLQGNQGRCKQPPAQSWMDLKGESLISEPVSVTSLASLLWFAAIPAGTVLCVWFCRSTRSVEHKHWPPPRFHPATHPVLILQLLHFPCQPPTCRENLWPSKQLSLSLFYRYQLRKEWNNLPSSHREPAAHLNPDSRYAHTTPPRQLLPSSLTRSQYCSWASLPNTRQEAPSSFWFSLKILI